MVYISAKSRQIKIKISKFHHRKPIHFLRVRNFLWGFTAPLHTQIWLCFRGNLVAILRCLPVLGKTGMLNLNFVKNVIKLQFSASWLLASPCYTMMSSEKTLFHTFKCLFVINNVVFNAESIILHDLWTEVKIGCISVRKKLWLSYFTGDGIQWRSFPNPYCKKAKYNQLEALYGWCCM